MKFFVYFLLILGIPFSAFANNWTLDVRAAYYSPQSHEIRDIYSKAWIDYQVFASKRVTNYWEFWAETSWTIKKGQTSKGYFGFRDRTKAWLVPVSIGARFIYPVACRVQAYLGAGASYSFLKIENRCEDVYGYNFYDSSPFQKRLYKHGPGALFKSGILIDTGDNTFIDLFADYFLQSFRLGRHDLFEEKGLGKHYHASGFKFGAGFGVNF